MLVSDLRVRTGRPRPRLGNAVEILVKRIFGDRKKRIGRRVGILMSKH
jgi:hypothetical protein